MKTPTVNTPKLPSKGFALISSIIIMSLLMMVSLAMLSLSSVSSRSSNVDKAQMQAQANARMALMIAIGELQSEMGPDMRISAESAIFDTDKTTAQIDGVQQSHWLSSYNAWGNWLNDEYEIEGASSPISISQTYVNKRSPMFRRWLLSLPEDQIRNIDAAVDGAGLNEDNSVILVGEGSLGEISQDQQHSVTRAYLKEIEEGNYAWWIGPENHKAKTNIYKTSDPISVSDIETSQGNTDEIGISSIEGFDEISDDDQLAKKLISHQSLRSASVSKEHVGKHFFHLTAHSKGLLTSVRTGALKKDLSLLLEQNDMPYKYQFKPNDLREPSIRPMSADLKSKNPKKPNRHFTSWTRLRHYYRMYRQTSDATNQGTAGSGNLQWDNYTPWTKVVSPMMGRTWQGSNTYYRMPIMAKLTFIYSLQSIPVPNSTPKKYNCYLVYTPIYTFWNPYNVELRIPNNLLGTLSLPYKILPLGYYSYLHGSQRGGLQPISVAKLADHGSRFLSDKSSEIVFKPGELKMFSYRSSGNGTGKQTRFLPGFDPQAIGGDKMLIHKNVTASQSPGVALTFANPADQSGNVWFGNTPGSLNNVFFWQQAGNWFRHYFFS